MAWGVPDGSDPDRAHLFGMWVAPAARGTGAADALVAAVVGWAAGAGWRGYRALREEVAGLDYLAVGLLLFPVAVLISLAKAGKLPPWPRGARPATEPPDVPPAPPA